MNFISNKTLVNICYLTVIVFLLSTGLELFINNNYEYFSNISRTFFTLCGTFLLLKNGNFIKTVYFKIALLCIALSFIGMMFQIMHWPIAFELLLTSIILIPVSYILYLVKFNLWGVENISKLIFVICLHLSRLNALVHFGFDKELNLLPMFILLVLINMFIKKQKQLGNSI